MKSPEEIARAARRLSGSARAAFLEMKCEGDELLRRRVEKLLAADTARPPPPPTVLVDAAAVSRAASALLPLQKPGDRIGNYRLLEEIGSGGFGTVWMAQQDGPVPRKVALKVIKLGMDTREVIGRFESERRLLAVMDHPNIAKVYDAGATETGRPYFVMELVGGVPITRFCDEQKLPTVQRLQLFAQVCSAVQHAHQKGIIHRDLKPTNILVSLSDGQPLPKVIDFGIAKATQSRTAVEGSHTQRDEMLGTPVYMSPEQAAGDLDIDTRCDVYSLGMLLYELLTGHTPFDHDEMMVRSFDEIRRVIREEEPKKPSTMLGTLGPDVLNDVTRQHQSTPSALSAILRGDLDWIVMKAIEKDRSRRYDTANGLAMDVLRHLNHQPIVARPPSAIYRLKKLVRRHRLAFSTGSVVMFALIGGSVISVGQAMRATMAEHMENELRVKAQESEIKARKEATRASAAERTANREKEATRQALTRAQIALADAACREQDGTAMLAALQQVPEQHRDSTWHYLEEKADTSIATYRSRSGAAIQQAAPHPTKPGVFVLVAADHTVSVVEIRTGKCLLEFEADFQDKGSPDLCMAVSPDGGRVALGKQSGSTIVTHDIHDGHKLSSWESSNTESLQFSPDGRLLLEVCRSGLLNMRDATSGSILWSQQGGLASIRAIFTPHGGEVLFNRGINGQHKLDLLNPADGTVLRPLPDPRIKLTCLAVSPDGTHALTGDLRGFVRCIDLREGVVRYEFRANDRALTSLAWGAGGLQFVTLANLSGNRSSLQLWDAQTGVLLQPLLGGTGVSRDVCAHPLTGEFLASGIAAKAWCMDARREKFTLQVRDTNNDTAFWSSDDFIFTQGTDSAVDLLDLRMRRPQQTPLWKPGGERNRLVSVSAGGCVAAVAAPGKDRTPIMLLRGSEGRVDDARTWTAPGGVAFLRLSPDGSRLLVRSNNTCYIADAGTGEKKTDLWDKGGAIPDAAWAGDSRVVVLLTSRMSRGLPKHEDRLVLFDAITGERLRTETGRDVINAIAVSPDGRTLATAGSDRIVRLRDAATMTVKQEMRAHDAPIMAVAFHPGRPVLATASEDLTVKLWDLSEGKLIEQLQGPVGPPKTLAFSPSGRRLACLSSDRTLRIWDVEPPAPAQPDRLGTGS